MRALLKLLVFVGVVVGLALVVDVLVARAATERAEERVEEALGVPADVELHGWPVGLRLLTGRVARAEMRAEGVPLEDVPADLEHLAVTLTGIRVGLAELRSPPADLPPAEDGTFEARLGGDATYALASVPSAVASLSISDGAVRLRVLGAEVAGDVQARDGDVVIVPRTPLGALLSRTIPLDLTGQPGDPRIEEAVIEGDVLVLRGELRGVRR
jgi:hypothetical protein